MGSLRFNEFADSPTLLQPLLDPAFSPPFYPSAYAHHHYSYPSVTSFQSNGSSQWKPSTPVTRPSTVKPSRKRSSCQMLKDEEDEPNHEPPAKVFASCPEKFLGEQKATFYPTSGIVTCSGSQNGTMPEGGQKRTTPIRNILKPIPRALLRAASDSFNAETNGITNTTKALSDEGGQWQAPLIKSTQMPAGSRIDENEMDVD